MLCKSLGSSILLESLFYASYAKQAECGSLAKASFSSTQAGACHLGPPRGAVLPPNGARGPQVAAPRWQARQPPRPPAPAARRCHAEAAGVDGNGDGAVRSRQIGPGGASRRPGGWPPSGRFTPSLPPVPVVVERVLRVALRRVGQRLRRRRWPAGRAGRLLRCCGIAVARRRGRGWARDDQGGPVVADEAAAACVGLGRRRPRIRRVRPGPVPAVPAGDFKLARCH